MRDIRFRAWDGTEMQFDFSIDSDDGAITECLYPIEAYIPQDKPEKIIEHPDWELMQFTGLKDKNGDKEVYECDIIDSQGNVIGNEYETPALLKDKANLLIQGFGTGTWLTTYSQAVERGCKDA